MNVSHEHKVIWWAPERTGTMVTHSILKNHNFFVDDIPMSAHCHSYDNNVLEGYTIICNMRNPYDRMVSIFINYSRGNHLLKKKLRVVFKEKFNEWIDRVLLSDKLVVRVNTLFGDEKYVLIDKWLFNDRVPDLFIKMEDFMSDFGLIGFVASSLEYKNGDLLKHLKKNKYKTNKNIRFSDVYDFKRAQKVYRVYKKHFFLCGYDPFSFTKKKLTDDEKREFLHGIII